MTSRLGAIIDKVVASGIPEQAASVGLSTALGMMIGPTAATLTGDEKADKDTMRRDMAAGALGGTIGGLVGPLGGALGSTASGLLAGMFDTDKDKVGSAAGQDLRLPVMGGTKFPTQDSVRPAKKQLQRSSAEVGPQPASTYTSIGKMKKVAALGDPMDPMIDDPLVLFLKRAKVEEDAKEHPPLTDLVDGSSLKNNLSDMPLGIEDYEQASLPPEPTERMIPETPCTLIKGDFDNAQTMRKKLYEKDHSFEGFDQGVVDRILGL